jgi:hypothetical protein
MKEINLNKISDNITERNRTLKSGGVVMAAKLQKTREMIDKDGNVIDPITKQIIKHNN